MAQARGKRASTGNKLVIVESPAKAKTIGGYLGDGLHRRGRRSATSATCRATPPTCRPSTRASPGPGSASTPTTTSSRSTSSARTASSRSPSSRRLVKDADELYLATDEDREGEAIAWHLVADPEAEGAGPPDGVPRDHPGGDRPARSPTRATSTTTLVDAQETRRILDRLYGYEVSPVLWKKVLPKLSAGRVQSVATRIVVERERERMAFRTADYWDIEGTLRAGRPQAERPADVRGDRWSRVDDERVATGRDFDPATGRARRPACCTWTRPARAGWPPGWPTPSSRSPGSRRSRTGAGPTRRS